MHKTLEKFLDGVYEKGRTHDAPLADRLLRLRNVEPDTARLLNVLVRAAGARDVLEIGTSNGHSTLWLADAVGSTGGRLTSVELLPERSAMAAGNLSDAGLAAHVDLLVEDGRDTLARSADARWDLVFLDAERPAYPSYWPDLLRVLRPGGLLAVDNVLSHPDQVRPFRDLVDGCPRVTSSVAPTGAGLLLVVRDPAPAPTTDDAAGARR